MAPLVLGTGAVYVGKDTSMTKIASIAVLVVAISAIGAAAWALQSGDAAPPFKLADQFGKTWELSALKNSVVVVVAADRDSGRAMGPWVDKLKQKYGVKIQLLGLMDLHGLPGLFRGIATSRIKRETKDPLMIDFDGGTSKAYQVSSKYPVVVVIDKSGTVRDIEKTNYTDAAFGSTTAAVDKAFKG